MDVAPAIRVRIKTAPPRRWWWITRCITDSSSAPREGSVTATTSATDYNAALSYRAGRGSGRGQRFDQRRQRLFARYGRHQGSALVVRAGVQSDRLAESAITGRGAGFGRDNGEALHFGISSPLFTSPNNAVTLSLTGSWGSSKYMQTYYGVNASQSAASGFARYDAGAGIYAVNESRLDAQAHPTLERGCWRRRYAADGDAADSPIVQRKPRRREV